MCPSPCPLCGAVDFYALPVAGKHYHRCRSCELVWLDGTDHLGPSAEKAVYDGHDNQVDDPRYRHFLMRAFGEVLSRVPPPASGLDFGCGPGPALIAMGREAGYQMAGYDKFYANLPDLLTRQYDFITSTEVISISPTRVLHWTCSGAASSPAASWYCRPSGCWTMTVSKPGATAMTRPTSSFLPRPRFALWPFAGRPTSCFPMGMWLSSPNPEQGVFIWS